MSNRAQQLSTGHAAGLESDPCRPDTTAADPVRDGGARRTRRRAADPELPWRARLPRRRRRRLVDEHAGRGIPGDRPGPLRLLRLDPAAQRHARRPARRLRAAPGPPGHRPRRRHRLLGWQRLGAGVCPAPPRPSGWADPGVRPPGRPDAEPAAQTCPRRRVRVPAAVLALPTAPAGDLRQDDRRSQGATGRPPRRPPPSAPSASCSSRSRRGGRAPSSTASYPTWPPTGSPSRS